MVHEYFEITISRVTAMRDDEFLELCSKYLEEALRRDEQRRINRQAREYGRRLGIVSDPDYLLDWYSLEGQGGDKGGSPEVKK